MQLREEERMRPKWRDKSGRVWGVVWRVGSVPKKKKRRAQKEKEEEASAGRECDGRECKKERERGTGRCAG